MKYLVIYRMDGFRSAKAFGSHSDAVDYINDCTDIIDKNISELKTLDDAHFRMTLKNGKIFNRQIKIDKRSDFFVFFRTNVFISAISDLTIELSD